MNNSSRQQEQNRHTTTSDRAERELTKNGHVYPKNRQMIAPSQNRWAVFAFKGQSPICQLVELLCLQEFIDSENNISTRIVQLTQQSSGVMSQAFENPELNENFVGYITRQERPTDSELIAFATSFSLVGDERKVSNR